MTLSNDSLNYFKLLLNTHFTQQIRPSKEEEEEEEHLRKSHIRSPGEKDVMKLQLKNALRNEHLVISGPSSLRRILYAHFSVKYRRVSADLSRFISEIHSITCSFSSSYVEAH